MTTLVTGGSGFIGSHLVDALLETGDDEIIIYDNFSTGDAANIDHVIEDERVTVINESVTAYAPLEEAVATADTVYHLAAAVGVKRIVDAPLESMGTNIRGTEYVLEAAAETETPTFIASSSEVYGKSDSVPFEETDDCLYGPTSSERWSYAVAKAADEFLAQAYYKEHDLPVVVGRFFNIVGPRQSGQYGMVIPRFVEQALAHDDLTVYGDGTQTRSFTHVKDAVRAVRRLVETPGAHGEVFNIGTPEPISINQLAERIIELTNSQAEITHIPYNVAYNEEFEDPQQREPDISKLSETVGWTPKYGLDDILHDVIDERTVELPSQ